VISSASDGGGDPACGVAAGLWSIVACSAVMKGARAGQRYRTLGTLTVFPQPGFGINRLVLSTCAPRA
jgi:hypothetical protein